jgi:hypothetical protein
MMEYLRTHFLRTHLQERIIFRRRRGQNTNTAIKGYLIEIRRHMADTVCLLAWN